MASLGLNFTAERKGRRSRTERSFLLITFCPWPGHASPWSEKADNGTALSLELHGFQDWAAAITKEFAVSWPPFVDLDLVLYFAKYLMKDYFRTSDAWKHSYICFFLKVIIRKALPLS